MIVTLLSHLISGCLVRSIVSECVVESYWCESLEINRTLERDQIAQKYQLNAYIKFDQALEEVSITFTAASNFVYPANLSVSFLYATRSGLDKEVNLLLTQDNIYRGNLSALAPGK